MSDGKIPVVELFGPTIQGEGALAGQISYFLRTGGCPYECSWCDSMHAVDPDQVKANATRLTQDQIIDRIKHQMRHARIGTWLTLSGGDPAIWDLGKVAASMRVDEVRIAIETQGSFYPDWFEYLNLITCSPKPPSSGMSEKTDYGVLNEYYRRFHDRLVFKVVIFSKADLDFARDLRVKYPRTQFYLSAGTPVADGYDGDKLNRSVIRNYKWLADRVLKYPELHGSIVGLQQHVLLWGHEKGK